MQRVILRSMAHRLNQILREHAKGASCRGLKEVSGREQRKCLRRRAKGCHTLSVEKVRIGHANVHKGSKAIKQSKQSSDTRTNQTTTRSRPSSKKGGSRHRQGKHINRVNQASDQKAIGRSGHRQEGRVPLGNQAVTLWEIRVP